MTAEASAADHIASELGSKELDAGIWVALLFYVMYKIPAHWMISFNVPHAQGRTSHHNKFIIKSPLQEKKRLLS